MSDIDISKIRPGDEWKNKFEKYYCIAHEAQSRAERAEAALEWYAEQLCEHSKDYEGCGKLPVEYCGGCRARAVLAQIEKETGSE